MPPQTLVIGYDLAAPNVTVRPLLSPTNLEEFNLAIWETSTLKYETPEPKRGWAYPLHEEVTVFTRGIHARLAQFKNWVEAGHTLIAILDEPLQKLKFGLSDNPHNTAELDLAGLPFLLDAKLELANGQRIKPSDKRLAEWAGRLEYHYVISRAGRDDLLVVETAQPGVTQAVASIVHIGQGQIIYVPMVRDKKQRPQYFEALRALHARPEPVRAALPEWVEAFGSPQERALKGKIAANEKKLRELGSEIAQFEAELDGLRWLKALAAGTDDDFLMAVKQALEILGYKAVKVDGKRTDIIAADGQDVLACETKGIERGGREEHLRQTNSWVGDVRWAAVATENLDDPHIRDCIKALSAIGVATGEGGKDLNVKGLLVLATYRTQPLDKREAEDFPKDMLGNAARNSVCVLTGHQLANLAITAMQDPAKKADIRVRIKDTSGAFRMDGYADQFKRLA